jgi:hypothetical protein
VSFPPSNQEHFTHQLERFEQARQWVESALEGVFEFEMRQLAKRFPNRRIELHSGMGSTQIVIVRRVPDFQNPYDSYSYTGNEWDNWPDRVAIPAPGLWKAIETYQDNVSDGKDPGVGVIIYENGKRIAGLAAGGAVR